MRPWLKIWLPGLLVLLVLASALMASPAGEQAPATDIGAADRATIRAVITDQIAPFRRDDAQAAFGLAAPNIQAMFGTPENFLGMVRNSYQAVYRPSDVAFGELVRIDDRLTQLVQVVGPDGAACTALYFMERQADGTWRIAGCVLTTGQGTTA